MSRALVERAVRSVVENVFCRSRVHGQSGHAADRADRPRMTHMRHGAVSEVKLSPLTAIVSE